MNRYLTASLPRQLRRFFDLDCMAPAQPISLRMVARVNYWDDIGQNEVVPSAEVSQAKVSRLLDATAGRSTADEKIYRRLLDLSLMLFSTNYPDITLHKLKTHSTALQKPAR